MKAKAVKHIAIVGAGIAGLALAILVIKKGYRVSVYEANAGIKTMGAGITLWPNAMFVMQKLGLDKAVLEKGGLPMFMQQYDNEGQLKAELDIKEVNRLCGYRSVSILRRDLMTILENKLVALGGSIRFSSAIKAQDIEAIARDVDLVVGADGRMRSVVRQHLFNDSVAPSYQGFVNIIGTAQLEDHALEEAIQDYRGDAERFGIVSVKGGRSYWAAAWATQFDKKRPVTSWYEEMHERFQAWPDRVKAILNHYEPASLNHILVHDIAPLPYWHKDNVLIIGDAAHAPLPTSGQGACQALEDAWHLVTLLDEHNSQERKQAGKTNNLQEILNRFYQSRIDKTTAAQNIGRRLASRIFSSSSEASASSKTDSSQLGASVSANQLREFWMQGLTN
ncbi:monooxygenase [Marinomonas sp. S3726]|uniref:FAD-dependent monooxygenase n=1 Tax=Marinomonas sp. S3726 TaxID=579484 RepID=UPI0005FA4D98|nr:FAD-dependent monooxygenase [Marinomonas sp. S3726]KJZ11229.1 monooxygenase [Marinomonas sp. S3726]